MMRHTALTILMLSLAAISNAGEVIVPVFALNLPGYGTNLWSTELYVTNRGRSEAQVVLGRLLPGVIDNAHPCLPPLKPLNVPPMTTVLWKATSIEQDLGCPNYALGALVVNTEDDVTISGRMVNTGTSACQCACGQLTGLGQEIPGLPLTLLPKPNETLMLPGLIYDPLSCGPTRFDTNVFFANPGEKDATVTILSGGGARRLFLVVNGHDEATPFTITLPAGSWRRLHIQPGGGWVAACGGPMPFDLLFTSDVPVASLASVIDRTVQDPRTVVPISVSD